MTVFINKQLAKRPPWRRLFLSVFFFAAIALRMEDAFALVNEERTAGFNHYREETSSAQADEATPPLPEQSPKKQEIKGENKKKNTGEKVLATDAPPQSQDIEEDIKAEDAPGTLHQDFNDIESKGLLLEGADGGLGEDVWAGSTRSDITSLIKASPSVTYYAAIQDLLRRLYLTQGKPDYLSEGRNSAIPGEDLLTLRLQKLEQMGLYSEATKMYSRIIDVPYHEHLARTGVLSMIQDGKASLGCLEARTVMNRFGELEFWQMLNAVCDISLSRLSPGRQTHTGLETNDIDLSESESKILQHFAKDRSFFYRVNNQHDIAILSSLERAALQAKNAFVFDKFRFSPLYPVSPSAFGIMLGSKDINESMRFIILVKSVAHGLKPASDIQQQYDLFKNNTREKPVGWRQLAVLYKDAFNSTPGPGQYALASKALVMSHDYGGPYALIPFADMIANAPPSAFSSEQAEDAIKVMLAAGTAVPDSWLQYYSSRIGTDEKARSRLFLLMSAELSNNLSTDLNFQQENLHKIFDKLPEHQKILIAGLYEKLDKDNKLHNYTSGKVYENLLDLTKSDDYVMPINDLTTKLTEAYENKRLGESILLSATVLQGIKPEDLSPGLLQEVIGGMRDVGLTKEARELAGQAISGFE